MPDNQNRKYLRSKIALAAQIIPEGGEPLDVMIKNLSLHGTMAHAQHGLKVDQKCQIIIQFEGQDNDHPILANGTVIRVQNECFGIKFDTVGFESHEELESMILNHTNDKEQCLKEFTKESFFFDPLSAFDFDPLKPR